MRGLITGGRGQLGSDLATALGKHAIALGHTELDATDAQAVQGALAEHRPDVVFNCAAYNLVDRAEQETGPAWELNAAAVRVLARACAEHHARLVHFSTNYVFPGDREEPYGEHDLPGPRSMYGATKLAGEYMALAYAPGALVIRTAGLYGAAGNASKGGNFVQRMLARAREHGQLSVVTDQRLAPTYTIDLAAATLEALEVGATGVVHLTNAGQCSWHEFATTILALAGMEAEVEPIATTVPEEGAQRPRNGVLARPGADARDLTPLRDWREALAAYFTAQPS